MRRLSNNGYLYLTSNFVMQWGQTNSAAGIVTVTNYHVPFLSVPYIGLLTAYNGGDGAKVSCALHNATLTYFKWTGFINELVAQKDGVVANWLAIGRTA